jgi:hypothetical protein
VYAFVHCGLPVLGSYRPERKCVRLCTFRKEMGLHTDVINSKSVPLHAMVSPGERGGIAPTHS